MGKLFHSKTHTEPYKTFESNLINLLGFLNTTEAYFQKQRKNMKERLKEARHELPLAEKEFEKLIDTLDNKERVYKSEEKHVTVLSDKIYDLMDVDLFMPMDIKQFRQFSEIVRLLGLSYLITIFEGYLGDIVRKVLLTHPDALKSSKQITVETLLCLRERKQIIAHLADNEVNELLYRPFPNIVRYFKKKFNLDLNACVVSPETIEEIMQTRNIHVHNRGLVNQRYLESVKKTTLKVGAYKPITRKYLVESIDSVETFVEFINSEVERKYFANKTS